MYFLDSSVRISVAVFDELPEMLRKNRIFHLLTASLLSLHAISRCHRRHSELYITHKSYQIVESPTANNFKHRLSLRFTSVHGAPLSLET